ncbi:hypothetical protein [Labedaea rhizosphaerae]|uniref:Excreted virulence factor EspC (Type VII ESX diderm) n=1 Tax=Labedaea rhizosphaerae TaxID=598644 RepID=A0A4R6SC94_LABRH|nr:hypothetical protein [Labedaea rhizosphaerae]TDP97127.1 hypothetical protein EV186_10387 [Labedaea rhizosphaerae]
MGESFSVKPEYVAGYGKLVKTVGIDQVAKIGGFGRDHARSDGGFTGLMELIKDPVDTYADKLGDRFYSRGLNAAYTGDELNRAAWAYTGADKYSYTEFNDVNGALTGYRDFEHPAAFPAGTDPTAGLHAPAQQDADIRALLDDVGGTINAVDDVINFVTGWSPVSEIVEPLSGKWTALTQKGEVLALCGDAAETASDNLTSALPRLDEHWDGGAAQEFTAYLGHLTDAISYEGPLNRTVGEIYKSVATEIEKVAKFMVEVLGKAVDKIKDAVASAWIPLWGEYKAYKTVREVIDIIQKAKKLVDELRTAIEEVKTVVEFAKDPKGFAEGKLEEKLAPIKDRIAQGEHAARVGADLTRLADIGDLTNAPTGRYQVGDHPRRPGA